MTERDRELLERVQSETGRLVIRDIIAAARAEGAAEMREKCAQWHENKAAEWEDGRQADWHDGCARQVRNLK